MREETKYRLWTVVVVILLVAALAFSGTMVCRLLREAGEIEDTEEIYDEVVVPLSAQRPVIEGTLTLEAAGRPVEFSEEEQEIYSIVEQGLFEMQEHIVFTSAVEAERVKDILIRVHNAPEFFWLTHWKWQRTENEDGTTTYDAIPTYHYSMDERDERLLAAEATADWLIGISDGTPEGIVETAIEWMSENVAYDHDEATQTGRARGAIDGAFYDRTVVCAGYSRAVAYCLLRAGYSAAYCTGYVGDVLHAWNMYEASDGRLVAVDATYAVGVTLPTGEVLTLPDYLDMDSAVVGRRTDVETYWYEAEKDINN